ncbi:IS66-like element accessory protein TnpA [Fodinicurvata sediminis]|uniref:IS66-like element accessory protein TnpA n=1 Tax=Fodinicurvata sediminis TaxID=1121832 RepID=UPI0003B711EA|nr:transposase [Fodinicurvata sediminis]
MRQEILTGVERRRRWSLEQKQEILAAVGVDGATVADVARRYDITRQHIYQWRRELRQKGLLADSRPQFLAVDLAPEDPGADAGGAGLVEIGLCNGRRLRLAGDAPEAVVRRMIRLTEAA